MGCRCNERREALAMTGKAIVAGDGHAIAEHAKFIANSAVQDLKAAGGVLKQQAQAARARLMQRRR
jgi:hypothetical protein